MLNVTSIHEEIVSSIEYTYLGSLEIRSLATQTSGTDCTYLKTRYCRVHLPRLVTRTLPAHAQGRPRDEPCVVIVACLLIRLSSRRAV
jgi:hypothetical protein